MRRLGWWHPGKGCHAQPQAPDQRIPAAQAKANTANQAIADR